MNGFSKVLAATYSMLGPFQAYDWPQQIQGIPRGTRYMDPHYGRLRPTTDADYRQRRLQTAQS